MFSFLRRSALPVLILAAGLAGLLWLSSRKAPPARQPAVLRPPIVETAVVQIQSDPFTIRTNGVVVPFREITLSAEVSGRIVEKPETVQTGRFVSAGAELIGIDAEPYQLELQKLAAQLKQNAIARRRLHLEVEQNENLISLAEQEVELAQREVRRFESLATQNASSRAEQDEAERTLLQTRRMLAALKNRQEQLPVERSDVNARRDVLEAAVKLAEMNVARTSMVAPVDGIIIATRAEIGDFVQAGDEMLTLQDTSQTEVTIRLRGDELFWLSSPDRDTDQAAARFELPSIPATISLRAGTELYSWPGQLVRSDGKGFDQKTRTMSCRIAVARSAPGDDATAPTLIRGMFVEVSFDVPPRESLLVLPRAALQPNGQVWVVSDEKLRVHEVEPVRTDDDIVLVPGNRSTLRDGDRVIVSPLPAVIDGMPVRVGTQP